MRKKVIAIAAVFLICFSAASCGDTKTTSSKKEAASKISSGESTATVETSSAESAAEVVSATSSTAAGSAVSSRPPSQASGPVQVDKGSKGMEVGLNFGGKKFSMAIFTTERYTSSAFTRVVKSFQTKFNCTIAIEKISFQDYSKQIAAKKLSGKPFDITFMHGSFFPGNVIADLHEPLNGYITTADLFDPANPSAGGIDYTKSSEFTWKGQIYGYASYYAVNPYMMFYNKKMFRDAGVTDPRTLYERGQWTWDKLKEIGKEVTDIEKNKFLGGYEFANKAFTFGNGGNPVIMDKGVPKENLSDPKIFTALKYLQEMGTGANRVLTETSDMNKTAPFVNGVTYMFVEESDRYALFCRETAKSNAFAKSAKNLGMVPVPLGPDNSKKEYPAGWIEATCAGKGTKEPRAAVAFAKYYSIFKDPVKDEFTLSAEDQKMMDALLKNIVYPNWGYTDSTNSITNLFWDISLRSIRGDDISKLLSDNKQPFQNCIKAVLDQQK